MHISMIIDKNMNCKLLCWALKVWSVLEIILDFGWTISIHIIRNKIYYIVVYLIKLIRCYLKFEFTNNDKYQIHFNNF